ncbi:hypothetical protein QF004_001221 [Chryseobacterium sp. MDT2-18]|nr:hypothetical protein [Chryseobacterium sp. MDT2-18]
MSFGNIIMVRSEIEEAQSRRLCAAGNGILFSVARVSFYPTVHGKRCLLTGGDAFGMEVLSVWDTV